MSYVLQNTLVGAVVGGAVTYLAARSWNWWIGKQTGGCGSCGSCAKNTDQPVTALVTLEAKSPPSP